MLEQIARWSRKIAYVGQRITAWLLTHGRPEEWHAVEADMPVLLITGKMAEGPVWRRLAVDKSWEYAEMSERDIKEYEGFRAIR